MNKIWVVVSLLLPLLMAGPQAGAAPFIYATGVTMSDPAKSYPVYILFGAPDGKTHLVDMAGNDVHQWNSLGFPSKMLDPALNGGRRGDLLVQVDQMKGAHAAADGDFNNIFHNKSIGTVDWNDKLTWSYGANLVGGLRQNHDYQRLPNGNTLILVAFDRHIPGFKAAKTADQAIDEVSPEGKVVWHWVVGDHIAEIGFSPEGLQQVADGFSIDGSGSPGRTGFLTLNDMTTVGNNHWFDEGDTRFAPDNILINSREANFVAIIDRKSGKIVWHLGPVYPDTGKIPDGRVANLTLPRPVDQMSGEHFAHIIPKGLPGAGNLLVLDNQGNAGMPAANVEAIDGSRVLEIDPSKKEIVWQFTGETAGFAQWQFHTEFMGSVHRLPNGNTLIDEAQFGHVFQITPKGEVVWDYVNPYFGIGKFGGTGMVQSNNLYRVQPIPYDWVPAGTSHQEMKISAPDLATFRVPGAP